MSDLTKYVLTAVLITISTSPIISRQYPKADANINITTNPGVLDQNRINTLLLAIARDNTRANYSLASRASRRHLDNAVEHMVENQWDKALTELRKVHPRHISAEYRQLTKLLTSVCYLKKRKKGMALIHLDFNSRNLDIIAMQGSIYMELGNYKKAEKKFLSALRKDKYYQFAYENLISIYQDHPPNPRKLKRVQTKAEKNKF